MRQARFMHGGMLFLFSTTIGLAGCTHNYYYGAVPQCLPAAPGTVQYGSVCDVPPSSGGTSVAQGGTTSSAVGTPPRVVVSEPSRPRLAWRRSDPEGTPTTRISGNIEDSTTTR